MTYKGKSTWPPAQSRWEPTKDEIADMDAADDEDRKRSETCQMDGD